MKLSLEWSMDDQPYEGFRKIPHMSILIIHQKINHLYDFFGGNIFSCLYSKFCLIWFDHFVFKISITCMQ